MICEARAMQISASSLLAAQQARTAQQPAKTAAKGADSALFEPLLFAQKPESKNADASNANPQPKQGVARLGAQIDIRV